MNESVAFDTLLELSTPEERIKLLTEFEEFRTKALNEATLKR